MRSALRSLPCALLALLAPAAVAFSAGSLPVSVAGTLVPADLRQEVIVEQDLSQPDMARVTLAGERGRAFAAQVEVGDDLTVEPMFKGEIVGIEPSRERAGDRVVIRALNRLHRLTHESKTRDFFDVTDAELVAIVARDAGLVPEVSSDVPSTKYDHVYQHNQTDLEFLRERAARLGFQVWCEDTTLLFGKRDAPPPVVLARRLRNADARLLRFHPRLSSSDTVQKVVVHGFDGAGNEISGDAAAPTILLEPGESNPDLVFGRTFEFTVDHPIFSTEEAAAIAKAKLEELTLSYVTGEAEGTGNPRIKPGVLVTITGIDDHFDGQYYVQGVSHRYTRLVGCGYGYKSRLRLRTAPITLFFLPEINDEVLVAFAQGDLSRPFVVGSLWDDGNCSDRPPKP